MREKKKRNEGRDTWRERDGEGIKRDCLRGGGGWSVKSWEGEREREVD